MKKLTILLVAILSTLCLKAETYVVSVGVSNYKNAEKNLYTPASDVKKFSTYMKTRTNYVTTVTSKHATKTKILSKLKSVAKLSTNNDTIMFLFSGHGVDGGIAAYDSILYYKDIIATLETSASQNIYLFIDACYAGSVENYITNTSQIVCFCGSKAEEYSIEGLFMQKGYFFQGMIKGIRGMADSNKDRKLTFNELYQYIYNDVTTKTNSKQHPTLICSEEKKNDVIFAWDDFDVWYENLIK